ncbi:MAG: hypothetical protein JXA42_05850 [Anaerolineales bacterium]|nr:hypothetical protein [Anaerolineales bacterium]
MPEVVANWIAAFANEVGVWPIDTTLLGTASETYEGRLGPGYSFGRLEFSFVTSDNSALINPLRYVVDVTGLCGEDAKKLVRAGIGALGDIPKYNVHSQVYRILDSIDDKGGDSNLYGVGVEHAPDGSICSIKTYWRFKTPFEELFLLSKNEQETFCVFRDILHSLWPRWTGAKLVAIDYLVSGENRFKVYLPQKELVEPLSLVTLALFLLRLGWQVNFDAFPRYAQIILGREITVKPTAFSLGFAIGQRPYVKLEIAAEAYFDDSNQALCSVCSLADSLNLDSSPLQRGFTALKKHSPFPKPPVIEVISLGFHPKGHHHIALYCRL